MADIDVKARLVGVEKGQSREVDVSVLAEIQPLATFLSDEST